MGLALAFLGSSLASAAILTGDRQDALDRNPAESKGIGVHW